MDAVNGPSARGHAEPTQEGHDAPRTGTDLNLIMACREDWSTSSRTRRYLLLVVIAGLAYEWGPGNETLTPWLSAALLEAHLPVGTAILLVPAGVAAFTFAQQLAVGLLTLYGLHTFPALTEATNGRIKRRVGRHLPPWGQLPRLQAVAISLSLGGSAVAVLETLSASPRASRTVTVSAGLCALATFLITGAFAAALSTAAHSGFESSTRLALRVLSNPLPWLALAFTPSLIRWARRRTAASMTGSQTSARSMQRDHE